MAVMLTESGRLSKNTHRLSVSYSGFRRFRIRKMSLVDDEASDGLGLAN